MPARDLPDRPNVEQYKKQAKELVKQYKAGDSAARQRVHEHHPRLAAQSDAERRDSTFTLADAQLVIAREHGFESWPKFAKHIQTVTGKPSADAIWRAAQQAVISGEATTLERLLRDHKDLFRNEQPPAYVPRGPRPDYSGLDARTIIAREHQFGSWGEFEKHMEEIMHDSAGAVFEAAADAIVSGDLDTLERLLREHPDVIRARSARNHHSMLMHYVGANGIEGWRQRSPRNAVKIAEALLDAGAGIDTVADMYGGNARTLGLVATSIHPRLAGVQDALIELLLVRGASFDPNGSLVNGCLANGRGKAAEFLARRGAPLDLEGAAGVGRLEIVKTFFNQDGSLKPTATKAQMQNGFAWACEFGRTDVVDFLLQSGMNVDANLRHHGQTGLHWAACGGHADTVKLLLKRGATVDAKDQTWGNTPLGWALYGWSERATDDPRPYHDVVAMLVAAGATVKPEWLDDEKVRSDQRMIAVLNGRTRG